MLLSCSNLTLPVYIYTYPLPTLFITYSSDLLSKYKCVYHIYIYMCLSCSKPILPVYI